MTIKYFIHRNIDKLALSAVTLAILFAYILEYSFGLSPCKLCMYQRIFYFSILGIILVKFLYKNSFMVYLLLVMAISGTMILSIYQSLLERGMIADLFQCGVEIDKIQDVNMLLSTSPKTSCRNPEFMVFGLTLANFSVLFSLSMLISYVKFNRKTNSIK
jgi:disulfide bond formation protein DsbB